MKIHNVPQGSDQWLSLRAGIPTASELDQLITPKLEVRSGEMPRTYLARKLAERWIGSPLQSFGGGAMEQGSILEEEALPMLEAEWGADISRPGFLTTDDGRFGASPDGLLADGTGIEIKCPQPTNHVKWLLDGRVPPEHFLQCQGGLYVTGAACWRFISYCRGFPLLVVNCEPHAEAHKAIAEAIEDFTERMDGAFATVVNLNGGGPKRQKPKPRPEYDPDPFAMGAP